MKKPNLYPSDVRLGVGRREPEPPTAAEKADDARWKKTLAFEWGNHPTPDGSKWSDQTVDGVNLQRRMRPVGGVVKPAPGPYIQAVMGNSAEEVVPLGHLMKAMQLSDQGTCLTEIGGRTLKLSWARSQPARVEVVEKTPPSPEVIKRTHAGSLVPKDFAQLNELGANAYRAHVMAKENPTAEWAERLVQVLLQHRHLKLGYTHEKRPEDGLGPRPICPITNLGVSLTERLRFLSSDDYQVEVRIYNHLEACRCMEVRLSFVTATPALDSCRWTSAYMLTEHEAAELEKLGYFELMLYRRH